MSRRVVWAVMAAVLATTTSGCMPVRVNVTPKGVEKARPHNIEAFVRDCESAVYGELDKGWRGESLVVGPLSFVYGKGYERRSPDEFRGRDAKYFPTKVLVVVENGAVATVTIPRSARRHASLLYKPSLSAGGRARVDAGDHRVRFEACRKGESPFAVRETQFNGAFIVAGPRCLPLHIRINGEARARPVAFSFGAGHCS
jgi:hypothetical protein